MELFPKEIPVGRTNINPKRSMAAVYFDRSVDSTGAAVGGGGGSTAELAQFPFQMTAGTASLTVSVRYGTVEDIEPTDIATELSLTDDATNTVYLNNTIDAAGAVTASDVAIATTGLPADSTYAAYKLIGTVITASGAITAINQSLMFSQGFAACGRDSADPATTPGTYHFYVD